MKRSGVFMEEAIEGRTYDHSSIHPIALVFKACVLRAYHSSPGCTVILDCGLSYPGLGKPSGLNQAFLNIPFSLNDGTS